MLILSKLIVILAFLNVSSILINCKNIIKKDELNLVHRNDDFIIFRYILIDNNIKIESSSLFIKSFLLNLCYPKNNNFFTDKVFIFTEESAENIAEIISQKLYVGSSYYIIYKKEDPIAPYSRIYRTIFSLKVYEDKLVISFIEIDKNIIFGNQYTYSDWVSFQDKAECNYKKNLSLFKHQDNVKYTQSDICNKDVFNNFSIHTSKLLKSPNYSKEKLEEKLNEINDLLKNGIINQSEYIKLRSRIIDNFGYTK